MPISPQDSQRRLSSGILLVRILVGWVFLSEGIQKLLFPAALGAGRFVKIGIPAPQFTGPVRGCRRNRMRDTSDCRPLYHSCDCAIVHRHCGRNCDHQGANAAQAGILGGYARRPVRISVCWLDSLQLRCSVPEPCLLTNGGDVPAEPWTWSGVTLLPLLCPRVLDFRLNRVTRMA